MRRLLLVLAAACTKKQAEPPPPPQVAIARDAATVATVTDAAVDAPPPVDAAPPAAETPCTAVAIKAVRKEADALVKAAKYREALALLDEGTCFLDEDQPRELQSQIAWRLSDRAFALYKAGELEACYSEAAGQLQPYIGNVANVFEDGHPALSALEHNAKLCHDAIDKQRGELFPAEACSLEDHAFAIPNKIAGAEEHCVHFEAGKQDADEMWQCGAVTLLRAQGGTVKRTRLTIDEGNLVDSGVCCTVGEPAFQKRGSTWRMLVPSAGRNCDGGTASMEAEDVYELTGTKLVLVHHLGAVHH